MEVHGSRGALGFNLMDPNWLSIYDNTRPEGALGGDRGLQRIECATRYPKPYALGATKNTVGWPQFHIHCLYQFTKSVASGDLGRPSFSDGYEVQRLIAACQTSAELRQWVAI